MQNITAQWRRVDTGLQKNIPLTLLKGLCVRGSWRPNKDCNILTPEIFWLSQPFFPVLLGCSTGGLGFSLSGTWSSFQHLLSNCSELQLLNRGSWGPPLPGAGSLYSILSPTDLNFLSPGLYNNLTSTLLPASVTISHSTPRQSRSYPDIPRPDAPVIYTGAFPGPGSDGNEGYSISLKAPSLEPLHQIV